MFGSRFCMGRVNAMEQSYAVFLAGDGVPERGADTLYAATGLGVIACALARFAVPLFFMVSGYYLRRDDMTNAQVHERMCLKVKRFGGLLLDWALFYLAWTLLRAYASDGVTGVRTALGEIFTIRHIF